MKTTAILAIGLAALAVSACAPGYYSHDRYGYYERDRAYGDRDRAYGDRDRAYGDRDRDGVPNYADRRPSNPYAN